MLYINQQSFAVIVVARMLRVLDPPGKNCKIYIKYYAKPIAAKNNVYNIYTGLFNMQTYRCKRKALESEGLWDKLYI